LLHDRASGHEAFATKLTKVTKVFSCVAS
jgi:hypothetical protein